MGTKLSLLAIALILSFDTAGAASADDFYQGKTIRIVVGFSAGGGFDTYARAIARHMSKHIPGQPAIVVENMTGAGSLIAANHVYKVAKPDGLTIGHFIGGLFLGQVLGQKGIEFDARKFEYLGAPITDHVVCAMTKASGITSVETWMASKTPVKMGGIAPGTSTPDNATRIFKAALDCRSSLSPVTRAQPTSGWPQRVAKLRVGVGAGIPSASLGEKLWTPAMRWSSYRPIAKLILTSPRFPKRLNWPRPTKPAK